MSETFTVEGWHANLLAVKLLWHPTTIKTFKMQQVPKNVTETILLSKMFIIEPQVMANGTQCYTTHCTGLHNLPVLTALPLHYIYLHTLTYSTHTHQGST